MTAAARDAEMHSGAGLCPDWTGFGGDWRWPDFSPRELACRCGGRFCAGEYWHDPVFLDALQGLRDRLGAPVAINSGHRCALWNAAVQGAPASQHKRIAADIRLAGHDPARLLREAKAAGFSSFGLYRSFIHMDLRPGRRWFGSAAVRADWTTVLPDIDGEASWWV